jgi:hypothetical protein
MDLWWETINALQSVMAHPRSDLLLRHRPWPRQQLRSTLTSQETPDACEFEFCLVLLHGTPECLSNSLGQFQPGPIHSAQTLSGEKKKPPEPHSFSGWMG